ncbi:hypothetical protein GYA19_04940 [Candidatus Beckwithbacteria bacterium]|nr:hypothetical protein [Candidatus Beckwithbacteria bacterium]
MKILFLASWIGREKYLNNYQKIDQVLRTTQHQINSDFILNFDIHKAKKEDQNYFLDFNRQLNRAVKKTDLFVIDVTIPTINLGGLITYALSINKMVIVTFGNNSVKDQYFTQTFDCHHQMIILEYSNLEELEIKLPKAVKEIQDNIDVRFNFFIDSHIVNYLNKICREKKISKSCYLRELIEKDMKKNKKLYNATMPS